MIRTLLQIAFGVSSLLVGQAVAAEPVELKFAYFISDTDHSYIGAIEPFVRKVNEAGEGLVHIEVVLNGDLGPNPAQQLQLVKDGTADFAFVITGYTPQDLPDTAVLELPGLFRSLREATLVHTRMAASGRMKGYEDVKVIGALATSPETFHSVKRLTSLAELAGATVRVNNDLEAEALTRLGMKPVHYDIVGIPTALGKGEIDGALLPLGPLVDFGSARIATNHYLLQTSVAPLTIVMNKQRFESLSPEAQAVIDAAAGEWLATQYVEALWAFENSVIVDLRSNARRTVTVPTEADQSRAEAAFAEVRAAWTAVSPHNADLLAAVESELAKIRDQ